MSISTYSNVYPTCFSMEKQPLIALIPSAPSGLEDNDPVEITNSARASMRSASLSRDPARLSTEKASNPSQSLFRRNISCFFEKWGTAFAIASMVIGLFAIITLAVVFPVPFCFGGMAFIGVLSLAAAAWSIAIGVSEVYARQKN